MSGHIASLQEQINALYNDLNHLRAQLGHAPPAVQLPPPSQPPPQVQPPQQQTPIDPSLQAGPYSASRQSFQSSPAPIAPMSPTATRPKTESQSQQPTFRGPTSNEFQFGVAKSSLQTMGIASGADDGSGNADTGTANPSPAPSPPTRNRTQLLQEYHIDKDPIWSITQEEALRLCHVYENEMGLMYPILNIDKVIAYAEKLYRFRGAAHRTGLMQTGLPGADSIEDEDTNLLKMVLATALTAEANGRSDLGIRLFECVQPAVDRSLLGSVGVKGIRLLAIMVRAQLRSNWT